MSAYKTSPVSKRLRFEVLRRDNHACRYCGATAPEVKLTVDHVIPVALGGTSDPSNLVTACEPCNAGKSSVPPDAPLVDDVAADALRWSRAMERAHAAARQSLALAAERRVVFREMWDEWKYSDAKGRPHTVPLPDDWENSIDRFSDAGIDEGDFREAIRITMSSNARNEFRYMCGVIWGWIAERQEMAGQILDSEAPDGSQADDLTGVLLQRARLGIARDGHADIRRAVVLFR